MRQVLPVLNPGLTQAVDGDRCSGWRGHLHTMLLTTEVVAHIPQLGSRLIRHIGAALDVLRAHLLWLTIATGLGTNCAAGDGPANGGDIVAPSATNLMPDYAANQGARLVAA